MILGGEFLEGEFFKGPLLLEKNRVKKFDPKIRVQNSGVKNSFHRIRAKIRVPEAQNPLCRLFSLRNPYYVDFGAKRPREPFFDEFQARKSPVQTFVPDNLWALWESCDLEH